MSKVRYSIECWVFRDPAQVLLLEVQAKDNLHPAFWQPITGGIEADETARRACQREIREETGQIIDESDLLVVSEGLRVKIGPDLTIDKTVFVSWVRDSTITINPDEHEEFGWFQSDRVANLLHWDSNHLTWSIAKPMLDSRKNTRTDEGQI